MESHAVKAVKFRREFPLDACIPPWWAITGHLQTILGHVLPSPNLLVEGERIELALSAGDKTIVRYIKGTSTTVVYLFHGLGGYSRAAYMQRTALAAIAKGHHVFIYNHRDCGEALGLAIEPYHSGRAEDLSALIEFGRSRFPQHKHLAIGFSLSGNALLLLAAGIRGKVKPDAAIAVNAPINLQRASELLKVGLSKAYDLRFMRDMRKLLRARGKRDVRIKDIKIPLRATLHDFDNLYTAPFAGFKNREDYYSTCSAAQYLSLIDIPTVLLTAQDDPFVDWRDYESAKKSPKVVMHIEKTGGHMGYLSAHPTVLGTRRWLDYALSEYMDLTAI